MATLRWAAVRPILDRLSPSRVLEIGCGQGGFGARIAKQANYLGVESDSQSCSVAAKRVEQVGGRVVHGDVSLVDVNEKFDLVCAFEVVEHIEDDVAALSDWLKWLSPGGSILVSVPAWPDRFGPCDTLVGHYRRYTPSQLDATLTTAGCVEVEHTLYGWPLGFVTEPLRDLIARRRSVAAEQDSMSVGTAGSGRFLQPNRAVGLAVRIGTVPFAAMQKRHSTAGVGLIGIGRI
jgi:SAM-dependent methyltransferase